MKTNQTTSKLMLSSWILFFLLVVVQSTFYAQGWERHYAAESNSMIWFEEMSYVSPTNDGGAFIFTGKDDFPVEFLKLIKVDQNGIVQYQHVLTHPIHSSMMYTKAMETTDGKYLVAAHSNDSLYLYKLDQQGILDWNLTFENDATYGNDLNINYMLDGGYLITTVARIPSLNAVPRAIKIDTSGTVEWDLTYNFELYYPVSSLPVVMNPNNTFSLTLYEHIYGQTSFQTRVLLLDSVGQLLSNQEIADPNGNKWQIMDAEKSDQGGMKLLIEEWPSTKHVLVTTDSIGTYVSHDTLDIYPANHLPRNGDLLRTIDGGLLIHSELEGQNSVSYTFIAKLGTSGNVDWIKVFPGVFAHAETSSLGDFFFIGANDADDIRVVKLDKDGNLYGNFLTGNVIHDLNLNCIDDNESGFDNWYVEIVGNSSFYGFTDSLGTYFIEVDTGSYSVNVISPGPFWDSCPINPVQVNSKDTVDQDLLMQSQFDCPYLTIDVSVPFLRRCFPNTYTVSFCNQGTIASTNTMVELDFHPHFDVTSSSIPWSNQSGNSFTFPIGNLNINQCGSFTVTGTPNCDSTILGQTLCVTANIVPDSICAPTNPNWDGSITDLTVSCGTDSLTFTIKNTGLGNVIAPLDYLVIEDNFITKQGFFQLNSLQSMQLKFPANGSTYRLYAGQSPGYFPQGYHPTIANEGCGLNANGTYSTGFINQFPENNVLNTETIVCNEIVGAYDPNDKQATPIGYGNEHYIEAGVDLEYHIRFQNTGTDTAFTVVIRDTISEHLDMASLLQGTGSHPYRLEVINGNVLKYTFDNILLPDSTVNEPASHGFVKFKISQHPNLPLGTTINNSAAIYFDFNEPIITNETWHEIGEDFLPVEVTSVDPNPEYPDLKISVQPNPFVHYAEFILEHAPEGQKTFELYDALGQLVRHEAFTGNSQHLFYKQQLSAGVYFYKILNNNQFLTSGKLIAGNQ